MNLKPFNKEFFESIPDHELIAPYSDGALYYTITEEDVPVGVVGYLPSRFQPDAGFVQVLVCPDWRGRGIAWRAEQMLAEKHGLSVLFATILVDNVSSIRAHERAGFHKLDDVELFQLRSKGLLQDNEVRYVKEFKRS